MYFYRYFEKFGILHALLLIPRPIPIVPHESINIWFRSNIMSNTCTIRDNAVRCLLLQCMDGYLKCYFTISYPHIIQFVHPIDDDGPSYDEESSDNTPPPPPGITDQ